MPKFYELGGSSSRGLATLPLENTCIHLLCDDFGRMGQSFVESLTRAA